VPTTVYTPYEYGCVGYSQEEAEKVLGKDNVEVYLSRFGITEYAAAHRVDKDGMVSIFYIMRCLRVCFNLIILLYVCRKW